MTGTVRLEFEPQVLESIESFSRKARVEKGIAAAVVLAATAVSAVFLALSIAEGQGPAFAAALAVLVITGLIYTYVVRRSFDLFVRTVEPADQASFAEFRDMLEAVSIGAGIETPQLVVLDVPTRNSLSFRRHGRPSVGITGELADTRVSSELAEAMMAHEVAHIILGDILRPLDLWRVEVLPYIALAVLAVVGVGLFLFTGEQIGDWVSVLLLLYWLFLAWVGVVLGFVMRRLDLLRRHDDIVADSVAAKLTSNPEALLEAIRFIDEAYDETTEEPHEGYCSRHLFVCPHDYEKWKKRHPSSTWRDFFMDSVMFGGDVETRLEGEKEHLKTRIANLMAIEQGHWPAFGNPR